MTAWIHRPAAILFLLTALAAIIVGRVEVPTWTPETMALHTHESTSGRIFYLQEGQRIYIPKEEAVPIEKSVLSVSNLEQFKREGLSPPIRQEYVYSEQEIDGSTQRIYYKVDVRRHYGFWSLLPALIALALCWITKEPVTSLLAGIIVGGFLLQKYDITNSVLVPEIGTQRAAGILVLYLWLLGGLMGIWSRTGAAQAFAELMTKHFVRGPKSAKFVAWCLGVIFFQGGTVSTVLVGTSVKPIADKNRVSHEELSYVVDSTASPIASQLAFNAWPGYIQGLIFVAGVPWLATESERISFFFQSVPFCFYAILAVTGTFLMSIEKAPYLGTRMRQAMIRARTTGELDAPDAEPLSAEELQTSRVPEGYHPAAWEFFVPLGLLIGIAIGTFVYSGVPDVRMAFTTALIVAFTTAILKGMSVRKAVEGVATGLKGVVLGSVILLLAIVIGSISSEAGGGLFLVTLLKESIPFWALPVLLQLITMVIAFSTGTSWGTYAITFPLAMPLSWAIASSQGLEHPEFFMTICFAAVMDGSVYGDQCSPISDTTVLSAMCTGCDLMDHVKSQMPPATAAAAVAAVLWTGCVYFFA